MTSKSLTRVDTLAIILGASQFPLSASLTNHVAFERSAVEFTEYLVAKDGFSLNAENLLWLFDADLPPNELDKEISRFLAARTSEGVVSNLIVYYVGHGSFEDDHYFLAIRTTRDDNRELSSLGLRHLARTLSRQASRLRVFALLDACFSGEARTYFQHGGDNDEILRSDLYGLFPERGVAIISSSSGVNTSKVVVDRGVTMFSEALLSVLWHGSKDPVEELSLRDVHQLTTDAVAHKNEYERPVRPELHSPVQRFGDISDIPIFPNFRGRSRVARIDTELHEFRSMLGEQVRQLEKQVEETRKRAIQEREAKQEEQLRKAQEEMRRQERELEEQRRAAELKVGPTKRQLERELHGWTEEEVKLFRDEAEFPHDRRLDKQLIRNWVLWRIGVLEKEIVLQEQKARKIEEEVGFSILTPTLIENIKWARKNGNHGEADYLEREARKEEWRLQRIELRINECKLQVELCRNEIRLLAALRDGHLNKAIHVLSKKRHCTSSFENVLVDLTVNEAGEVDELSWWGRIRSKNTPPKIEWLKNEE